MSPTIASISAGMMKGDLMAGVAGCNAADQDTQMKIPSQ